MCAQNTRATREEAIKKKVVRELQARGGFSLTFF